MRIENHKEPYFVSWRIQIAQSEFSTDRTKILQAYCAIWLAEMIRARCVRKDTKRDYKVEKIETI